MRGRRPKPTRLKLLDGNPGKRRLNRWEPKPKAQAPRCPTWLNREAKAEWRRVVPVLVEMKVVARIDRACLTAYCLAWSRLKQAEAAIQKDGLFVYDDKGQVRKHPALTVIREADMSLRAYAAEFGLTASSRSRVEAGRNDEPEDALTKFMRRKGGKAG